MEITLPISSSPTQTPTNEESFLKDRLHLIAKKTDNCAQFVFSRIANHEETDCLTQRSFSLDAGSAINHTSKTSPIESITKPTPAEQKIDCVYDKWHHPYPASELCESILVTEKLNG